MVGNQVIPSLIRKHYLVPAFAASKANELLVDDIANGFQISNDVKQGDLTAYLFLGHLILVQLCQVALSGCLQFVELVVKCRHTGRNRHPPLLESVHALPQHLRRQASHAQHRSEEHTSELQSHSDLVCRLLLEKKQQKLDVNSRTHSRTQHMY